LGSKARTSRASIFIDLPIASVIDSVAAFLRVGLARSDTFAEFEGVCLRVERTDLDAMIADAHACGSGGFIITGTCFADFAGDRFAWGFVDLAVAIVVYVVLTDLRGRVDLAGTWAKFKFPRGI
jgi:hypothetical protein